MRCGKGHEHGTAGQVRACYEFSNTRPTDKQVSYLNSLRAQHGLPPCDPAAMSRTEISEAISSLVSAQLVAAGVPAVPAPAAGVPAGYYAVPSATGNNDLDFFAVDRPKPPSRWAGRVFVSRIIGGGSDDGIRLRGSSQLAALEAIGKDPAGAAARYGRETGRCGRCNRLLTDQESRARGIGPVCWARS